MEATGYFDKINEPETVPVGDLDVTFLPLDHYLLLVYNERSLLAESYAQKEHLSVDVHFPIERVYLFCRAENVFAVVTTHQQSFLLNMSYQPSYQLKEAVEIHMHTLSTLEGIPIKHARKLRYTSDYCPSELVLSELGLPTRIPDLHHIVSAPASIHTPYTPGLSVNKKRTKLQRNEALHRAREDVLQYAKEDVSKEDLLSTLQGRVRASDCVYISHAESFGPVHRSLEDILDEHDEIDLSRIATVDIQNMFPMLKPRNERDAWIQEALNLGATTYGVELRAKPDSQPKYLGLDASFDVSVSARALASFWQPGLPAEIEEQFDPDMTIGPAALFPTVKDLAKKSPKTESEIVHKEITHNEGTKKKTVIPAVFEAAVKRKRLSEMHASQPWPEPSSFAMQEEEEPASLPIGSSSQDIFAMPSSLDDIPATQPVPGRFAERPKPKKAKPKKKSRLRGFK
ncbi:hypothetical protein BCR43DRAFT_485164 [Syncephalastrum racemosum]|uniref:RRN6 K-rich C-terminal domain-containing protein n=1 Tax=Syncephalastrum racemosum TaxID=13706 RepID=A0A1X2HM50_SYNRA|nr:hypothetical protein BCR43DRAFT_485164 [Syncephalastrum racemosum]